MTWKKPAASQAVTGYQLRYRMKGNSKWKTLSLSAKKTTYTLKNLKKGKRYQIQFRSVRTAKQNGKTVKQYSPWSKTVLSKAVK